MVDLTPIKTVQYRIIDTCNKEFSIIAGEVFKQDYKLLKDVKETLDYILEESNKAPKYFYLLHCFHIESTITDLQEKLKDITGIDKPISNIKDTIAHSVGFMQAVQDFKIQGE